MIKINNNESHLISKHDQFLELIRQTQIPGAVSYHYERPSNYNAYAKTQGSRYEIWEATEEDAVLGFTQITFDQILWNNVPVEISYSGDTRVSLKARGRRISDSLIKASCSQSVPVFGAVLGNNRLVLEKKLNDWDQLGINFKQHSKLKAMIFRPANLKISSKNLFCRTAQEMDLVAMFHLWNVYSKTRNLPRYYPTQESFSESYFNTTGVSLENTFLIFDGISLIAMLSTWNQSKVRKMVVDQKNIWMKIASRFISLPEEGEELKVLYSFQHAFLEKNKNSHQAMQMLIQKARTNAFLSGAHFFSLGLDENDPVLPSLQKSALVTNTANIILDSRGREEFNTSEKPLHLEVGMG